MTKLIPLTRGLSATVDDEDFDALSQHKWMAKKDRNGKFYAVRSVGPRHDRKSVYMAREIMKPESHQMVDHRDGDTLRNVRSNLRLCSRIENQRNRHGRKSKSGFKGVRKRDDLVTTPWIAEINVDRKNIHLGYFATDIEAARAYDAAAVEHFGEFANLNFKEPNLDPAWGGR